MTEQRKVPEMENTEEEQADQLVSVSEEEDDLLQTSTSNIVSLDARFLFFVDRSSRFGRSIKINSRILSYLPCHCNQSQYRVDEKYVSKKDSIF